MLESGEYGAEEVVARMGEEINIWGDEVLRVVIFVGVNVYHKIIVNNI